MYVTLMTSLLGVIVGEMASRKHRPLTTTVDNLQDRLLDIPLNSLPITFREALMFTSLLGMRYLWVDSLCIVQNDQKDWHQEAEQMGPLYSKAILVIAAAASRDSTEGLFGRNSTAAEDTEHDARESKKSHQEAFTCFNIASREPCHSSMSTKGPLTLRAWAFQEWLLATRLVFLTPTGPFWMCRRSGGDGLYNQYQERMQGVGSMMGPSYECRWLEALEQYTKKLLTYPTDRLIALTGVANQIAKSTKDTPLFGVWNTRIAEQLLWKCTAAIEPKDTIELPSWSWAATGGAKQWMSLMRPGWGTDRRYQNSQMTIQGSGLLRVKVHTEAKSGSGLIRADAGSDSETERFIRVPPKLGLMKMRATRFAPAECCSSWLVQLQSRGYVTRLPVGLNTVFGDGSSGHWTAIFITHMYSKICRTARNRSASRCLTLQLCRMLPFYHLLRCNGCTMTSCKSPSLVVTLLLMKLLPSHSYRYN